MTTDSTRLSSVEPGIGERQRALRARHVGGVRSRFDDHEVRAGCGEQAVRFYSDAGTVSRDPECVRWPLRPRLVARERETAEAIDCGLVFDDGEIDVESRSAVGELDDGRVEREAQAEHDVL